MKVSIRYYSCSLVEYRFQNVISLYGHNSTMIIQVTGRCATVVFAIPVLSEIVFILILLLITIEIGMRDKSAFCLVLSSCLAATPVDFRLSGFSINEGC